MPPVMGAAISDLVGSVQANLRQGLLWLPEEKVNPAVMELVTEADCSTSLVIGAATPQSPGNGLVDQPAMAHQVQSEIGSIDLQALRPSEPIGPGLGQGLPGNFWLSEALYKGDRLLAGIRRAYKQDHPPVLL